MDGSRGRAGRWPGRRRPLLGVVAAAALAGACAGGPPPDAVSDARTAAARFALAGRAFAVSLAKQCRFDPESGDDLSSPAKAALDAWSERNERTVEAARLYVEDLILVTARRSGRRAAQDKERELSAQESGDGARAAAEALERAGGRESCAVLLEQLEAGQLDFASAEFEPLLEELRTRYPAESGG